MYRSSAYSRKLGHTIDWRLIVYYLLLVIIGWVNIYAATHATEIGSMEFFETRSGKQLIWIASSLVLAGLILFVFNPRLWEVISIPAYIFVVFLLVAVIFFGIEVKGSRSWFGFGPVRFQPAEVSKIASSLMLATIMSRPGFKMSKFKDFALVAAAIALPMLIIMAEKETGSALVYVGFIFALYREGLSGWYLFAIGMVILVFILTLTTSGFTSLVVVLGVTSFCFSGITGRLKKWFYTDAPIIALFAFLPSIFSKYSIDIKPMTIGLISSGIMTLYMVFKSLLTKRFVYLGTALSVIAAVLLIFSTEFVFNKVLQDHQRSRIEVLLGMKEDPAGVGYNVRQSMIAIGSGGAFGKGFLKGTQTTYGFVPEQSTDFIFCTVGEERGFVGAFVVIMLYVLLISRIINDAEKSRESFTRIYGYCVACCIFMHLFINIGMTIGLMPVIGIPLPLLSYGGSSLWAFTILIFIFIALNREERKYF